MSEHEALQVHKGEKKKMTEKEGKKEKKHKKEKRKRGECMLEETVENVEGASSVAPELKRKKEKKRRKKERKQDDDAGANDGSRKRRDTKKDKGDRSGSPTTTPPNHSSISNGSSRNNLLSHLKQQPSESIASLKTSSSSPRSAGALAVSASNCADSSLSSSLSSSSMFPYKYILAPMVGASELAFRLLCRKYGADLCYTPMMSAHSFATDPSYRETEFQTCPQDRPLVCHFCANTPQDFAEAVRVAAPYCDAIDLNLGCPQRTAYVGHFGSYLLDPKDRQLVCDIIRAGVAAAEAYAAVCSDKKTKKKNPLPICCKIRLLDTVEETVQLCQQLQEAGVSWIAIHARYRASWERQGPSARDGPALLDQVQIVKQHISIPIIANGNVITFQDVLNNLELTQADAVMSAEGMLDDPALFLPRWGSRQEAAADAGKKNRNAATTIVPSTPTTIASSQQQQQQQASHNQVALPAVPDTTSSATGIAKKRRKLEKRLREIKRLEDRGSNNNLTTEEQEKVARKTYLLLLLRELDDPSGSSSTTSNDIACGGALHSGGDPSSNTSSSSSSIISSGMSLCALYETGDDKLALANEYLSLVRQYPVKIRSVVFHIRRVLKDELIHYQLMEDLLTCETVDQVQDNILRKMESYRQRPESFVFDRQKAKEQKEALERKKREEGKRTAYEARMIRKAKREGKQDHNYYLHIGAAVPTQEAVKRLKAMHDKDEVLEAWKKDHSQHCMSFHLDPEGCKRGRACAFLHVDVNSFVEGDEVAG